MKPATFFHRVLLTGVSALAMTLGAAKAGAHDYVFNYDLSTGQAAFNWTAPATGTYAVAVYGAQGGGSSHLAGGLGAEVGGDLTISASSELLILVGEQGFGGSYAGGGGGASIVFDITGSTSVLFAAGGGGGAGYLGTGGGGPGLTGTSGGAGFAGGGVGGTNGRGGQAGQQSSLDGGGGAGVLPLPLGSAGGDGASGSSGHGAPNILYGGAGVGAWGGAGGAVGGGGAGGTGGGGYQNGSGGGGGGFSGGGGGVAGSAGGGGGSYVAPTLANPVLLSGVRSGDGYVTIDLVSSPSPAVPEASTWAMMATGFGALGLAGLRRARKPASSA